MSSEHDQTVADCTEAIRLNPNDARAFAKRGDAYRKKGDYVRAIADLTEAIRLDPTYSWAFGVRGNIYRTKGNTDNDTATLRHLGTGESESRFLNTDAFDRAISDLTEAIRLNPTNSPWPTYLSRAYASRGKTYRRMLNYDRAIADCTEAIRFDPQNAEAFAVRGDVLWAKDEYDLATADLTEAVRLDPKKDHKDLLDKVKRSIRNAAAKDKPASKPETKPASTLVATTPTQKPSKPTPVQPPQQAQSTFMTICVYCFTEYSCSEPVGTVLHCNQCGNNFTVLPHLGHKDPSAVGLLTGLAFGASGLYAGDVKGRVRAAQELKITDYPREVVHGLDAEACRLLRLSLNCVRRHLSVEQKRLIVKDTLRATSDLSNNYLGGLTGVDGKTVAQVREELEATLEIPRLTSFRGKDGKTRPRHVLARTTRETNEACEALRRLGDEAPQRLLTAREVIRKAARVDTAAKKETVDSAPDVPPDALV